MGTRRTIDRKRSRGKGVKSASNMSPTPTADLPDEDPDAAHEGEFIVTVLEEGQRQKL
jgi:hypothetical protein